MISADNMSSTADTTAPIIIIKEAEGEIYNALTRRPYTISSEWTNHSIFFN